MVSRFERPMLVQHERICGGRSRHVRERRAQQPRRARFADVRSFVDEAFHLTERFRLTAEAEAFNLFNRVNFNLPQAVQACASVRGSDPG